MDQQLLSRRLDARQHQEVVNERRRIKHLPVARALRDPSSAPSIIASAKIQIGYWRDRGLCSLDYIAAWEALLAEPMRAADILEEQSAYAVQMRQNSPFVSAVRQFQALTHAA